ncbi:MAG: type II toxin-antitoxin system HicB family antitoxin [Planctomycetes bacterium]|nr:type II toxin-antitoxin system HicB family antitoxin [Planctomycetota bacterium]
MKLYSFQIVIEKEPEDEGYFAYSPQLHGCFSSGKTIEETKANIRQAVQQHIEFLRARSQGGYDEP